ncbi:MAG: sugar ABC transporter permease [Firmicutes bacterium]|jgi:multiple sugar transport system permease protein|nr:sugar ABC transporter permease [Bacillota bacterium]
MTAGLRARIKAEWERSKVSYMFVGPFLLLFTVFTVVPVVLSIVLSFTDFNTLQPPKWVGLQNYIRLFLDDDVFQIAVKNTFIFAAVTGPLSYLLCFIFAWLINELRPGVRALLTLLFYAPSISGNAYMIWHYIFSGDMYGYLNGVLLKWGIIDKPLQWLIEPEYIMPIVVMVALWMSLGTSFLVFIAGLQGLDPTLFEAAAIDGVRNRWQELWYITLPSMKSYLMFGAILTITNSFAAAGQITNLVGYPSTDYAAHTVMQHLQDYGNIRYEMGYASTIAVVLFVTMVTAQRVVQRLLGKLGQ